MNLFSISNRGSQDDLKRTFTNKFVKLSHIQSPLPPLDKSQVHFKKTVLEDIQTSMEDPYREARFVERSPVSYRQIRYKRVSSIQLQEHIKFDSGFHQRKKGNLELKRSSDWITRSQPSELNLSNCQIHPYQTQGKGQNSWNSSMRSGSEIFPIIRGISDFQGLHSPLGQKSNILLTKMNWNTDRIKEKQQSKNEKESHLFKKIEDDYKINRNLASVQQMLQTHSRPLVFLKNSPKLSKHNYLNGKKGPIYFHKN